MKKPALGLGAELSGMMTAVCVAKRDSQCSQFPVEYPKLSIPWGGVVWNDGKKADIIPQRRLEAKEALLPERRESVEKSL